MVRLVPGGLGLEGRRSSERIIGVHWELESLEDLARSTTVASLNLSPKPGDIEANLRLAESEITKAREAHPDLRWVVLPEMFTTGYTDLASIHRCAEDAEHGMSVWRLSALAHSLGLYIAYGFPESLPDGGVADSANLVGPGHPGPILTYRKRNLVQTNEEMSVFVPGSKMAIAEVGGLRVALVICWDLGYPEVVREAARAGADLILVPAAWRSPWGEQYALSCAARALDNAVYLASANQIGAYPEASFDAPGRIHGPDGTCVSHSREQESWSVGVIEPGFRERWRASYGDTFTASGDFLSEGDLEEIC